MRIIKSVFSPIRDSNLILAEMKDRSFMVGEENAVSDRLLGISSTCVNTDDKQYAESVLRDLWNKDMEEYEEGLKKQRRSLG